MDTAFVPLLRPGYFGRRRDQIVSSLNEAHGHGGWRLEWRLAGTSFGFAEACASLYEASYLHWFIERPEEVEWVCRYGEVIDNATTNIQSGCDYTRQEAFSTHIQDIAVRNVLRRLKYSFLGSADDLLTIRGAESNGHRFGPGNIPFLWPSLIEQPSKAPRWAHAGSVEDFWQSNKWLTVRETQGSLL